MPATLFTIFAIAFVTGALTPATPFALVALLLLALFLRSTVTPSNRTRLRYLILALTALTAGYLYALIRTPPVDLTTLQKMTGAQTLTVEVIETPRQFDYSQRFKAKTIGELADHNLLVTAPLGSVFRVGDQLQVTGVVELDRARTPPVLTVTVKNFERLGVHRSVSRTLALFQNWLWSKLIRTLPPNSAELITGLLYGRQLEDPSLRSAFRNAGLSHLTAVSGYNLTIVASAITHLLAALALPRLAITGTSLLAIFIFTLFTGASGSVVRACLMGVLLILVRAGGRIPLTRNVLLGAALGITLLNPSNLVTDLSFQLSLLAITGILYLAPPIRDLLQNKLPSIAYRLLTTIIAETLGAQLAVMPLLWYYFGQINLLALPINLLVTPFVPFLMFCGFLAILFLPLSLLSLAAALPFLPFAKMIELLGRVPSLSFPPSLLAIIILYLGLAYTTYALNQHRLPDFHPPGGKRC